MKLALLLFFPAVFTLPAQTSTDQDIDKPLAPACNSYRIEETPLLSFTQRFCLWADRSLFSGEGMMGALVAGTKAQFTDKSSDLQKGAGGFAIRVSTRYAQSVAKGVGETLGGYLNHEGARKELGPWKPRPGQPFGRRFAGAITAPFWNYDDDDAHSRKRGKRFAVSRIAASLASGFSGMAWTPDRLNTPGNALKRSASSYGGYFASSLLQEFKPDLLKLLHKL